MVSHPWLEVICAAYLVQGNLIRFCSENQFNEFFLFAVPFNIEFSPNDFFYFKNILIPDMSLIRPGMNSNTISAKLLGVNGGFNNIRVIASSAVTKCSKFINVNG